MANLVKTEDGFLESETNFDSEVSPYASLSLFVPRTFPFKQDKISRSYELNILQRLFIFLEMPSSSKLSKCYSIYMIALIVFSVVILLMSTQSQ